MLVISIMYIGYLLFIQTADPASVLHAYNKYHEMVSEQIRITTGCHSVDLNYNPLVYSV